MVELLQTYQKQQDLGVLSKRLDRLDHHCRSGGVQTSVRLIATSRFIHKVSHRLPAEAIDQLVHDYQAGQSTRQLMQTYGLGKGAVLKLLERAGTSIRHQGLNEAGRAEAARLYASGLSAARVASRLGCSPDSVTAYARAAGVTVRPRQGGRQATG